MKRAFTIAEVVVTLCIVGVLASIILPMISSIDPKKDKMTYNKALYSIQGAVSNAMDETFAVSSNTSAFFFGLQKQRFCQAVANSLNIKGQANCINSGSYDRPNFVTSDGMKYWYTGNPTDTIGGTGVELKVDRKLSSGEQKSLKAKRGDGYTDPGLSIVVAPNGRVYTGTGATYENHLIENAMLEHDK